RAHRARRCRGARRDRQDDQAAPRIHRGVREGFPERPGGRREGRDQRSVGLPARPDGRSRNRTGGGRGDRRVRRERRQGHGQGDGAAQAAPCGQSGHGQGFRAGEDEAHRLSQNRGVIPDSFKQDLLNRVDIVDVVSGYVQLKKGGANYLGLCPFHNEKTPSFTVSPAKQFYHCFGCQAHGNAVGFLMAYSTLGYIDAVKELAAAVGMQVPESRPPTPQEAARKERETDLYALMEKAMEFYRAELKKSPRAIDYLKGRGLTGEIAARFRIGYAPDGWQSLKAPFPAYEDKALGEAGRVIEGGEGKRYDRFRDRVLFPSFSARGWV